MIRRQVLQFCTASAALPWFGVVAWAAEPATLAFSELYKTRTVLGMAFSERCAALAGKPVIMAGYMAPPLKADANFFVLTRTPVSICPFCSSDADWPADIVVVYLRGPLEALPDGSAIRVAGRLEVGSRTDAATGFVSQLRLVDAKVSPV